MKNTNIAALRARGLARDVGYLTVDQVFSRLYVIDGQVYRTSQSPTAQCLGEYHEFKNVNRDNARYTFT